MAINKDSNGFTFGFAAIMVVVVGAVLSITAISLKPRQKENMRQEKMKNIMMAIGAMDRSSNMAEAPALFDKYVKEQVVVNASGEVIEGNAFEVDVRKEYKSLPFEERNYPLYICEKDGETYYVVPMVGTGLWGPVWGFIALEGDMNTVYGANFDHKTETPGLGAEINTASFQSQFPGENIFDESGKFVSIDVLKGGGGDASKHAVDGITGGTITSVGVGEMIKRTLGVYVPYFQNKKA
jgi:Na+-transporting NADH:ubiquinone oxidoreductase subunit C